MSTVDDIKAKIDLADYLREQGIVLKQAGASFKACCPFHNEKSPSFMVHREKQVWHCFGCSKGGDLFTFVQEREGLDFGEALKLLADRAGVKLEARDPRLEGQRTRGLSVLELAAKWYRHQLEKMPAGKIAREYVTQRGIAPETAEAFQIGYAPDAWDGLMSFLLSRKVTPQEIIAAGLAIAGTKSSGRPYDRFRHRLMFPIHDALGRVVGFTGRILEGGTTVGPAGETPAKYVNTPETVLYKKGAVLYGLWRARDAIRSAGYAVLVEGQMDVVACHEAGVAQAVAASGTALTSEQLKLLKRYTTTMHMAFDVDAAGENAASRGIDAALDAGFDVRVIRMPLDAQGKTIGKDADECIRKDADAWRAAIAAPTPVLDYFIDRVRTRYDLRSPAGQRDAGRVLIAHLAHVQDAIERAAWVRRCADAIGVPEAAVVEAVRKARPHESAAPMAVAPPTASVSENDPIVRAADRLLAILLRDRTLVGEVVALLPGAEGLSGVHAELYNMLALAYSGKREGPTVSDGSVVRLSLLGDREYSEWGHEELRAEAITCARAIRRVEVERKLKDIERAFRTATPQEHDALAQRFELLRNEKRDMG